VVAAAVVAAATAAATTKSVQNCTEKAGSYNPAFLFLRFEKFMRAPFRISGLTRSVVTSLTLVAAAMAAHAQSAPAPTRSAATVGSAKSVVVAEGLEHPWALAFLPGEPAGRMLVTERAGRMRIVSNDGQVGAPLSGLPSVHAVNQGGLLDVVAAPDFQRSRTIYFTFAQPASGGARTAVASAQLGDNKLENVKVIFAQADVVSGGHHFGSRIAIARDGSLFITTGERYTEKDRAQSLQSHLGKVIHINADGSVPKDNPFAGSATARGEIWSYGHRNMQGAAIHPVTGRLWTHEHGPRGGDEINIAQAGKNYGWPVIGYGIDYSGLRMHEATAKAGMEQPLHYWLPSIAPSGMAFYTADRFPQWKNSLFVGALAGEHLARLTLDGERVISEERLLAERKERIRDVRQGPDGYIYAVTDEKNGKLLRVSPN
jgi:glucose/arabinose dehydrogenase